MASPEPTFLAPPKLDEEYQNFASKALKYTLITFMLLTIPIMLSGNTVAHNVIVPLALAFFSFCYLLLQIKGLQIGAALFVSVLWLAITVTIYTHNGLNNVGFFLYAVVIIYTNLLFASRRLVIGITILSCLSGIVLIIGHSYAILPLRSTAPSLVDRLVMGIGLFASTGILLSSSARVLQRSFQHIRESEKELNARNLELENLTEQLKSSEERFRIISSVTSDYTFSSRLNPDGELEHILLTGAFEAISGYSPQEFLKIGGWQATLHPDDIEEDERAMDVLRQNKPVMSEVRIIKKNGDVRWVRVYAHPVWDTENNRLMGINGGVQDITEHKAAETALRESEEKYRLLYTSMNEGSGLYEVIYDEDGNAIDYLILEVNPSYLRITGHSKEEVVGKLASEIAPPLNLSRYAQVVATGKPIIFEGYYPELDKTFHSSVFHVGGSRFATIFTDITKRKRAEQDLHNSEERYRALFENAPISIGLTAPRHQDEDGKDSFQSGSRILMVNKAWEQMYDYSLEEINQLDPYEPYQNPEDRDRLVSQLQRDGFLHNYEVARRHKDGTPYYSSLSMTPFPTIGVGGFLIMEIDITEQKKAEEAILNLNTELESKAKQLTTLNQIAHDISLVTDLSSTLKRVLTILQPILPIDAFFVALYDAETETLSYPIMYDNGRFYDQESLILTKTSWASQVINTGQPMFLNRTPEDVQAINKEHRRIGDTNQISASVIMTPLPIGNKNIGVISVQSYTFNAYNEKHTELLTGAGYQIAIAVENARLYDSLQNELTERKRLEGELQEYTNKLEILVDERTHGMRRAKEQVELILNNTSDALLFAEPNGDIIVTNPAFRDGFGQQDIRSIEHIFAYIDDEEQIRLISSAMLNVIQHGQSQRVTVQVSPNHNGVKKDLDIALIPVRSSEEEPISGILLSGRDITQQKEIERFKARFVADALHDLATPISGISMRTYLLERSPDRLAEHVQALQNQVQHLTNLLEDLRTLSRLDRAEIELNIAAGSINQLVRLVFDTYEPVAINKGQQLTLRLEQSLPELSIDQRQIERVLVNLVSNAVSYTEKNKEIVIETLQEETFLIINVIDEGMGIEAEDLPRVFERFYRPTKHGKIKKAVQDLDSPLAKRLLSYTGVRFLQSARLALGVHLQ